MSGSVAQRWRPLHLRSYEIIKLNGQEIIRANEKNTVETKWKEKRSLLSLYAYVLFISKKLFPSLLYILIKKKYCAYAIFKSGKKPKEKIHILVSAETTESLLVSDKLHNYIYYYFTVSLLKMNICICWPKSEMKKVAILFWNPCDMPRGIAVVSCRRF